MYKNLSPSSIGVSARQSELVEIALTHRFRGFEIEIGEVLRGPHALGGEHLDSLGAQVVHDQLVPALHQSPYHVAPHPAQPDHRQLHWCRSLEISVSQQNSPESVDGIG